jgi:PII-like signaling protein
MIPPKARLLSVYLNANDRWHGRPLYRAVVELARTRHLAGASVFPVELSLGAHRRLRDAKSEYLAFDIPVVIEIVDAPEAVEAMLGELRPMIAEGLATVVPVRVVRYSHAEDPGGRVADLNPTPIPGGETTMLDEGEAQRLTVYVGSSDAWRGRNLAMAIVERCRELGLAGATAMVGVMGFGKHSRIHRAHLLGLSEDLPERVEVVDRPDQIARLLPALDEMIGGGLVVVEDVKVLRYRHDSKKGAGGAGT